MKRKLIEAYMGTARNFAACSTANRLKVGAIIVDSKTGAIISVGYNGMPSGLSNECEHRDHHGDAVTKPEVLHAEENAIAKLARSTSSAEGCWMFVTHSPCIKCARLIVASGIQKVVYEIPFKGRLGCGLELLNNCKITTEQM